MEEKDILETEVLEETEVQEEKTETKKEKKDKHKKEIEALKAEIEKKDQELAEFKDRFLRTLAEAENFKKRIGDEAARERKYIGMDLSRKLLEPLDNLERALDAAPQNEEMNNYLQGFKIIKDQIVKVLETEGVKEIETEGKIFDPNYHQAVMMDHDDTKESQEIIRVLQKGYTYKDRILRPAMVVINE